MRKITQPEQKLLLTRTQHYNVCFLLRWPEPPPMGVPHMSKVPETRRERVREFKFEFTLTRRARVRAAAESTHDISFQVFLIPNKLSYVNEKIPLINCVMWKEENTFAGHFFYLYIYSFSALGKINPTLGWKTTTINFTVIIDYRSRMKSCWHISFLWQLMVIFVIFDI